MCVSFIAHKWLVLEMPAPFQLHSTLRWLIAPGLVRVSALTPVQYQCNTSSLVSAYPSRLSRPSAMSVSASPSRPSAMSVSASRVRPVPALLCPGRVSPQESPAPKPQTSRAYGPDCSVLRGPGILVRSIVLKHLVDTYIGAIIEFSI